MTAFTRRSPRRQGTTQPSRSAWRPQPSPLARPRGTEPVWLLGKPWEVSTEITPGAGCFQTPTVCELTLTVPLATGADFDNQPSGQAPVVVLVLKTTALRLTPRSCGQRSPQQRLWARSALPRDTGGLRPACCRPPAGGPRSGPGLVESQGGNPPGAAAPWGRAAPAAPPRRRFCRHGVLRALQLPLPLPLSGSKQRQKITLNKNSFK